MPGPEHRQGQFVNCYWFMETFKLGDSPTQDIIVCHARTYIMVLFGGLLFSDKSGFRVSLK